MEHYCKDCKKPIMASAGGTYCRFHKKELCDVIKPHCYSCGKDITQDSITLDELFGILKNEVKK